MEGVLWGPRATRGVEPTSNNGFTRRLERPRATTRGGRGHVVMQRCGRLAGWLACSPPIPSPSSPPLCSPHEPPLILGTQLPPRDHVNQQPLCPLPPSASPHPLRSAAATPLCSLSLHRPCLCLLVPRPWRHCAEQRALSLCLEARHCAEQRLQPGSQRGAAAGGEAERPGGQGSEGGAQLHAWGHGGAGFIRWDPFVHACGAGEVREDRGDDSREKQETD